MSAHPQTPRDTNEKPTSKPKPHQTVTSQAKRHAAITTSDIRGGPLGRVRAQYRKWHLCSVESGPGGKNAHVSIVLKPTNFTGDRLMTDYGSYVTYKPNALGMTPLSQLRAVSIEAPIFNTAPSYALGLILCWLSDEPAPALGRPDTRLETLDAAEQALRLLYPDTEAFEKDPQISAWQRVYRALQVNPRRYPCAADALGRRVVKGKSLPRLGPIVDVCNALSLRTRLPIASCDLDGIACGRLSIRRASGRELFTPLGSPNLEETVDPGEVVYTDGHGRAHSRRWNWRQSHEVRTTASSRNLLLTVESVAENSVEVVRAATNQLIGILTQSGHSLYSLPVLTASQHHLDVDKVLSAAYI